MDPSNMVVLSGNQLVRVDTLGAVTVIGSITGSAYATMARNSAAVPQLAIVMDGQPFVVTNYIIAPLVDADLPPPNSVFFLDQRLVFTIPDGRLFWTDLDAVTVNALSFATAEGAPDGLIRGYGHRLDGWLFGAETTEVWRATSNADSPFQRAGGGFIPKGCSAPFSVATIGETIYWVGNDDIPYSAPGYSLTPLVHGPVCRAIRDCTDKTLITGFSYYEGGYGFWELSGPGDDLPWTWIYNATTQRWFEGMSYGMTRSRRQFGVRFANANIVGDTTAAKLYKMNAASFDEAGNDMVMTLRSPPMHAYPNCISVDRMFVDCLVGNGDSDSKIGVRWSDDGGHSFSRQRWAALGTDGAHQTRVNWNGLGSTREKGRIWELQISSSVIRGILYAAIEGDRIGT
jgi:hypothetical protein